MFPLYDENPTRITPYITYGLIGLNVLVFLHELSLSDAQLEQFFQLYAVVPRELTNNLAGEWTTLFTSQFLHGGWWHLISNMVVLWVFGNNIEDRLGHFKYLIFYLGCGALAALCYWAIGMNSAIPFLAASSAISGVLGAYIIRFPHTKVKRSLVILGFFIMTIARALVLIGIIFVILGFFITTIRVPALVLIGIFFVQNVISGLANLQAAANMSYWANIGGFVFGIILGPVLGLFRRD